METVLFLTGGLLTITMVYIVGFLLFLPFDEKQQIPSQVNFFLKLATGLIGIIVLTALFYTKGKTVLAIIPLLYIVVIWLGKHGRQKVRKKIRFEWKQLLLAFCLIPVFLAVQLYRNDFFNEQNSNFGDVDAGVYTTVSEYLPVTGVEVPSPWYHLFDLSADHTPKPYHYDDLWLLGFIQQTTVVAPIDSFNFILIPVLAVVVFFCHLALFRSLMPTLISGKHWYLIVAFLAVFTHVSIQHLVWSYPYYENVITFPKASILPILLVAGWLSYKYLFNMLDSLFYSSIAIANILFLPIIFFSILVFFSLLYFLYKDRENLNKIGILTASVVVYFIFYVLLGSFQTSCIKTSPPGEEGYYFWLLKIWTAQHVKHFLFFSPVYIGFVYFFWKRIIIMISRSKEKIFDCLRYFSSSDRSFLLLIFLLFESSTMASASMNNYVEYFQISQNIHTTLAGLAIVWLIAMLRFEQQQVVTKLRKVVLGLLFLQLLYGALSTVFLYQQRDSRYDTQFITDASSKLTGKNPIGISINNLDVLTTYNADPRMCIFCNFLKKVGDGYWANQVTVPEQIEDLKFMERRKAVELSPFYRFIQKQKSEGNYKGYEQAQIDFIERYKVDFAVVEAGALVPPLMLSCADIVLVDGHSGVRLVLLKRPCSSTGID